MKLTANLTATLHIAAVVWDDAHASAVAEYSEDEIARAKPFKFTSVGLLVRADETVVAIAGEQGEDGKFRGVTFIPRGMVVSIHDLGSIASLAKRGQRERKRPEEAAKVEG
jgi:hypothetical protein